MRRRWFLFGFATCWAVMLGVGNSLEEAYFERFGTTEKRQRPRPPRFAQ